MFPSSTSAASRAKLGLAAIGLLAVGGFAGGAICREFQPPIEMAPIHAVPIRNLANAQGIVTIRGRVAERFGNRWVIDDGTGRTLVDAGPRGESDTLAPSGATVSVQGRFDRGAFHPSFLVDASGTVTPLGPPRGPHGRHGHPGPRGPEAEGPDAGGPEAGGPDRGAPPPPPPPPASAPQPAPGA